MLSQCKNQNIENALEEAKEKMKDDDDNNSGKTIEFQGENKTFFEILEKIVSEVKEKVIEIILSGNDIGNKLNKAFLEGIDDNELLLYIAHYISKFTEILKEGKQEKLPNDISFGSILTLQNNDNTLLELVNLYGVFIRKQGGTLKVDYNTGTKTTNIEIIVDISTIEKDGSSHGIQFNSAGEALLVNGCKSGIIVYEGDIETPGFYFYEKTN
ncbi:MAG: hypothetical protein PHE25_03460 [Candidatus Gracilibacteria bacterium]|nr:hypothetical protein [Candidatus Gracilibacteria bacterium]